ncbi:hypothetical protein AB4Z22_43550, partial [Paenibacillus sp. TAF58]
MKVIEAKIRNIFRICILCIMIIILYYSYLSQTSGFVIPDDKYIRAIRLDKFMDRFDKKKMDRILIVRSTIEG